MHQPSAQRGEFTWIFAIESGKVPSTSTPIDRCEKSTSYPPSMPCRYPRGHRQESLDLRAHGAGLAIGYCRVDSGEAPWDGLSLTIQARRIRDYAAA